MDNISKRRVLFAKELHSVATFRVPIYAKRRQLLKWLETNTDGEFFLGMGIVSFANEQDVLMFKLGPHYDRERNNTIKSRY